MNIVDHKASIAQRRADVFAQMKADKDPKKSEAFNLLLTGLEMEEQALRSLEIHKPGRKAED